MSKVNLGLSVLGLCVVACGSDPQVEMTDIGSSAQTLFGDLSTHDCTPTQRTILTTAHVAGMKIAMTEAFDACLRRRVMGFYKPCQRDGYVDPFKDDVASVQYEKARAVMRSGNTAGVTVTCKELDGPDGWSSYGTYDSGEESMNLDDGFINGQALTGLNDWATADVAGAIWHEAMHQHGYLHDENDGPELCGYPPGQYSRGANSIPYIADRCMRSAGISGRLILITSGAKQSLGIGWHRASAGDFGNAASVRLIAGPALRVRICTSEVAPGEETTCPVVIDNDRVEYSPAEDVSLAAAALIIVEPLVLLYRESDYRGGAQALTVGEYRASNGSLALSGGNSAKSSYVPPGARARICSGEGGPSGHGSGSCQFLPTMFPRDLLPNVTYVEVQPVVTAFAERGLYGLRTSYGPGRWQYPMGDNDVASLVVPPGLTARACSDWSVSGSGTCRSDTRTVFDLGSGLADAVSFLQVTPAPLGTVPLTVRRAIGSGPGTVKSTPYNLVCTSNCTGEFATRNEVSLKATSTGYSAYFSGCDRVSGSTCTVTMTAARTVTVDFRENGACAHDCFESCIQGGATGQQCSDMCGEGCID